MVVALNVKPRSGYKIITESELTPGRGQLLSFSAVPNERQHYEWWIHRSIAGHIYEEIQLYRKNLSSSGDKI